VKARGRGIGIMGELTHSLDEGAQAVDKVIHSLDDNSLTPAAAKGTADAGNDASAKDLACDLANLLAAANKKKQYTVELTIGINYRHVPDLTDSENCRFLLFLKR